MKNFISLTIHFKPPKRGQPLYKGSTVLTSLYSSLITMARLYCSLLVINTVLSLYYRHLASGSGDTTVRFWDLGTETPDHICKGHKHWILCLAWSPDGLKLASGCRNGHVCNN